MANGMALLISYSIWVLCPFLCFSRCFKLTLLFEEHNTKLQIIKGGVDEKDLISANSRHQLVNGFSTIAGAFLGEIFISAFGYLCVF